LWFDERSTHSSYAEQSVDVKPGVTDVELGITALPPPAVLHRLRPDEAQMYGLDPALQWADGTLVAYLDGNANGQLDMRPTLDAPSPDQIVGAATDIDVLYLAAGQPPQDPAFLGVLPTVPGFSLVREPPVPSLPMPGQCGSFDATGHKTELCQPLPSSAPLLLGATDVVALTLQSDFDPRWSCSTFLSPLDYPDWSLADPSAICDGGVCPFCAGYQCPPDLPPAGLDPRDFACSSDGLAYVYRTCHDEPSLCGTTICHYGHGERLAGDPAPAGWPCP
jgi:hypothetical protein